MTDLPANVYRLPQRRFDAIPGAPWVYWVSDTIRELFEALPSLAHSDPPKEGINTGENERFVRFWWEVGKLNLHSNEFYLPFAKGAPSRRYFDRTDEILRSHLDQIQLLPGSALRNQDTAKNEAIAFLSNATGGFRARFIPSGSMFCSTGGRAIFPVTTHPLVILGLLNSSLASYILSLINPTVTFTVGDIGKIVIAQHHVPTIESLTARAVRTQYNDVTGDEAAIHFIVPNWWNVNSGDRAATRNRLNELENQIDDEVYRLYGISDADRTAIEAELAGGGALEHEDGEDDKAPDGRKPEEREGEATAGAMTREELAVRWISYAVGIVLGRFTVGQSSIENRQSSIGNAVYRRDDFAIGSLPAPDEAEFDELVGPVERFAYVDAAGGRHVFSAEVEQALRDLSLPDGIAVLDEGHPRDLPALVEKALELMIDDLRFTTGESSLPASQIVNRQSEIVNQVGGDLRKFLEKDFFTKWHLKWYRKRPVYWPLQSARRGYGFVLFHERVEKYTLYVLLRDYLDHKLNGLRLQIEDLVALAAGQTGAARRQTERQLDRARQLLDEVNVFAQTIDRIAKGGYQPEANWIDDGVILRLAPLWELIPLWKAEPKKYWERLEQGDYDWSHIAMAYWPARVRAACQMNKSFAIAHGHEEWFAGS